MSKRSCRTEAGSRPSGLPLDPGSGPETGLCPPQTLDPNSLSLILVPTEKRSRARQLGQEL